MTVTPQYVSPDNPAALVEWLPGEDQPAPVKLCLHLETGELWFRADTPDGFVPANHMTGIVQTWPVELLAARAANTLLEWATPHAANVLNGSRIDGDGSNRFGVVDNEAARDASGIIEELAESVAADRDAQIPGPTTITVETANEALEHEKTHVFSEYGITGDLHHDRITDIADRIHDEYLTEGFYLLGIEAWLYELRDELLVELGQDEPT